jgi:hypothetical protein
MPGPRYPEPVTKAENRLVSSRVKALNNMTPVKLVEIARNYSVKSVQFLAATLEDPDMPPAVRLRAAEILLDRGWGKAAQSVSVEVRDANPGGVLALSIMERVAQLKAAASVPGTVELEPSDAQVITDEDDGLDHLAAKPVEPIETPEDLL